MSTTLTTKLTRSDVLVDPLWLAQHLHDPQLRVVEIDVSPKAYDAGHIPGAVFWNVYTDLKDANYQLLDKTAFAELLSRSGIDADTTVVFYGYAPATGVWLMKLYGHVDARMLDCARDVWENEGLPWDADVPAPTPTRYHLGDEDPQLRVRAFDVERAITDSTRQLIDVRSEAESWAIGSGRRAAWRRVAGPDTFRERGVFRLMTCAMHEGRSFLRPSCARFLVLLATRSRSPTARSAVARARPGSR